MLAIVKRELKVGENKEDAGDKWPCAVCFSLILTAALPLLLCANVTRCQQVKKHNSFPINLSCRSFLHDASGGGGIVIIYMCVCLCLRVCLSVRPCAR